MDSTMPESQIRAGGRLVEGYSLEMTGKDVPGLRQARRAIPPGSRVNITFLANEGVDMRVAAAQAVRELGFVPVPHISARCLRSRHELETFLRRLQHVGASEHVFVVGGDPAEPRGSYPDALTVIESGLLRRYGVREVSVAGYPEGHPLIPKQVLAEHLRTKVASVQEQGLEAGIISQFGFDTDPVVDWIRDVRRQGISAPIRVGTPGPAGIKRLLNYARRFGIGANAMIVKKYGFSLTNLIGTAGPDRFVGALGEQLATGPAAVEVGIHLYAFGGLLDTARWANDFINRPVKR